MVITRHQIEHFYLAQFWDAQDQRACLGWCHHHRHCHHWHYLAGATAAGAVAASFLVVLVLAVL
jgi:hypothetical protein